jgi:hypothetical protein
MNRKLFQILAAIAPAWFPPKAVRLRMEAYEALYAALDRAMDAGETPETLADVEVWLQNHPTLLKRLEQAGYSPSPACSGSMTILSVSVCCFNMALTRTRIPGTASPCCTTRTLCSTLRHYAC